jgi:hypothetical protein
MPSFLQRVVPYRIPDALNKTGAAKVKPRHQPEMSLDRAGLSASLFPTMLSESASKVCHSGVFDLAPADLVAVGIFELGNY